MNGSAKAQMAAYAAAALLLVIGGAFLLKGGGGGPPGGDRVSLDGAGGTAAAGGPSGKPAAHEGGDGTLYVHVAGAVRRPGVYRVTAGSRVAAAVRRAGGLTRRADLTAVNLASPVRDAQQVIVPRRGEAGAAAAAGGAAPGAGATAGPGVAGAPGGGGGKQISLATATPQQLDTLEGIGPKLAAAIIAYRDQHRGFKSVDELREVEGIGEKRFAAIRGAVRP